MKKIIILVLSLIMLVSCFSSNKDCNDYCPAFDFNTEQLDWFLFPENNEIYSFKSSTENKINFEKEIYEYTEDSYIIEEDCSYSFWPSITDEDCKSAYLQANYVSSTLRIENIITQSESNSYEDSRIEIEKNGEKVFSYEFEDYMKETEVFTYSESIEINEQIFNDIISFKFYDDSGTVFISKGKGLVRLIIEGETYDIE